MVLTMAATLPNLNPAFPLNECNKVFDFHRHEPSCKRDINPFAS